MAALSVPLTGARVQGTLGGVGHGSEGPVMRNQSLLRAGIKIALGALAGFGLVKLLAYERANRAPAPGTLPDPPAPPAPGVRADGTVDPDAGVGVFGADGEPLTDAHGKPVLLRLCDLTPPPPTVPPWEMQPPPDPAGTVRRGKRRWFDGMTGVVEAPPDAPQHYRLGDDGKVYCIEDPSEPGPHATSIGAGDRPIEPRRPEHDSHQRSPSARSRAHSGIEGRMWPSPNCVRFITLLGVRASASDGVGMAAIESPTSIHSSERSIAPGTRWPTKDSPTEWTAPNIARPPSARLAQCGEQVGSSSSN